jgi:glycosyltransferase involved in cell wall biosynthesis
VTNEPGAVPEPRAPLASVVVPAHDEEAVLGALLTVLAEPAASGELEVVVAANGCTDGTVEVAAGFPGVRVVEVAAASKIAALNAGDQAASAFPRIYLDADIDVDLGSLRAVVRALRDGAPAAAPSPLIDTTRCGPGVRAYYLVGRRIGYWRHHVIGAGIYGVSAAGRARWGAFPDLVADDSFVYGRFEDAERVNPPGATFVVRPPRTLRSLHRRHVRIALGNFQLAALGHAFTAPGPDWWGVLRERPWLVAVAPVYLGVNGLAQVRARRLLRRGVVGGWNRDDTSRVAVGQGEEQRR